jgi:hypothetical protein
MFYHSKITRVYAQEVIMDEKNEELIDEVVDKMTEVTTSVICAVGGILLNFFDKEEKDAQEDSKTPEPTSPVQNSSDSSSNHAPF